MNYRAEIDGLRTIAILPVILFHFGVEFISGGFLGVDIFFVISGYLITSIIMKDISKDRFSLITFYEKRARRILPALMAVLVASYFFSLLMLTPVEVKDLSQSLVSVATFTSNIYFYLTSGYFSTKSEEIMLLHTWSLSIEEQFYIFFPFLLLLGARYKKTTVILVAVFIMSFICSLVLLNIDKSAAFYLIVSRAWELVAGALCAVILSRNSIQVNHTAREWLSWTSVVAIAISLVVFSKSTLHPGWPTLVPIIAVCCLILFSQNTQVGRLLSHSWPVTIGMISYSLYLWHQPIVALIKIKVPVEYQPVASVFGLILTFVLSWATYKLVEQPFRNRSLFTTKKILTGATVSLSIMILVGLLGHFTAGFPQRTNHVFLAESMNVSPVRYKCHTGGVDYQAPKNACKIGKGERQIAVLGDSHGVELSYALGGMNNHTSNTVTQLTFSGCPAAYNVDTSRKGCKAWLDDAIEYITMSPDITHVVLAFRHTLYVNGEVPHTHPVRVINKPFRIGVGAQQGFTETETREAYWASFQSLVSLLKDANKTVIVMYPIPELQQHIKKVIMPTTIFNEPNKALAEITPLHFYEGRNVGVIQPLDQIVKQTNSLKVNPATYLCNLDGCGAVFDKKAMYFDDNHLSQVGANTLVAELFNEQLF